MSEEVKKELDPYFRKEIEKLTSLLEKLGTGAY